MRSAGVISLPKTFLNRWTISSCDIIATCSEVGSENLSIHSIMDCGSDLSREEEYAVV